MLPANLSVYLDEASDDPIDACEVVASLGLRHVILRRLWSTSVVDASDPAFQKVAVALRKHNLQVTAIATDCGRVPIGDLDDSFARFKKALLIAAYFKAKLVRIFGGVLGYFKRPVNAIMVQAVQDWLTLVGAAAQTMSVIPVLETDFEAIHFEVDEIKTLLSTQPGIQLVYDPAALILRRVQDPLAYWMALKKRVVLVDLRDYEINRSFRPLGHGDCNWYAIRADLLTSPTTIHFALEPSLGRIYGPANSRAQTLKLALGAVTAFWDDK